MNSNEHSQPLLRLTADIISAHVKNNQVATAELPQLIEQVYLALRHVDQPPAQPAPPPACVEPERAPPAVSVKKSIFADYIICLEDGRKLKTLKRHLRSTYNMTPEQYREKWGLAPDYPMVAPNYAEHRSALAKQAGLGRKTASPPPPEAVAEMVTAEAAPAEPAPAEPAEMPRRERRPDLSAAAVFANFTRPAGDVAEAEEEAPASPEAAERKSRRKPFSKQLARGMRR